MDLRKQILSQMKLKGLNQKELAQLLGMSESQLSMSLKILSEGFIDRLEEKGIIIDDTKNKADSGMVVSNSKLSKKVHLEENNNNNYKCMFDMKLIEQMVDGYKEALKTKDELINQLKENLDLLKNKK